MDFQSYLIESATLIDGEINKLLKEWSRSIEKDFSKLLPLTKLFEESCAGGKRLRGTLVRLGYLLVNEKDNLEVLKPAAAVELFQTSILAHDDIIDLSETRRGKPTLYRVFGGDHYGISQTICLGDIGFFLSLKAITDCSFPEDLKNKAASEFSKMFINTGLGEMLDIEIPHLKLKREEQDVLAIYKYKTAYYTIVYPLMIGVILGGGNPKLENQIKEFGESLGIAFQIQDDILGVFGDEKTLGKSVTSDIEEGKNTVLITYAQSHGDKEELEILDKYYGSGKIGEKEHQLIKNVFTETGALDCSQKLAGELVRKSKQTLQKMKISDESRKILAEMADFIIARNK